MGRGPYRHPATHADRRDDFVLERGIRPVVKRMEQAAYDGLFNKESWRNSSSTRRNAWKPVCGTIDQDGGIFLTQGHALDLTVHLVDDFASYPINLFIDIAQGLPSEFWTRRAELE